MVVACLTCTSFVDSSMNPRARITACATPRSPRRSLPNGYVRCAPQSSRGWRLDLPIDGQRSRHASELPDSNRLPDVRSAQEIFIEVRRSKTPVREISVEVRRSKTLVREISVGVRRSKTPVGEISVGVRRSKTLVGEISVEVRRSKTPVGEISVGVRRSKTLVGEISVGVRRLKTDARSLPSADGD